MRVRRFVSFVVLFALVLGFRYWQDRRRDEALYGPEPVIPERLEPAVPGDPFLYAKVAITQEPVPERYARPLPSEIPFTESTWDAAPPRSHVADHLCAGQPDMLRRAGEAMRRAVEAGHPGAGIGESYAELVEWCEPSPRCDWARGLVLDPAQSPALRDAARRVLAECGRPADADIFEAPGVPSHDVIEWWDKRSFSEARTDPEPPPSLVSAARAAAMAGDDEDVHDAVFAMSGSTPARKQALLDLAQVATTPRQRLSIASALPEEDPDGRALMDRACAELPDDVQCRHQRDDLDERLRKAFPDAFSSQELEALATEPPPTSPEIAAERARVSQSLIALGLLRADAPPSAHEGYEGEPVAATLLAASGHGWWFDAETDQWPNEHDSLARHLAALVAPELDDIVFAEEPPSVDDETAPYVVHAWSQGRRVSVQAANLGDWWDVDAVVGLVNTLLRERGSTQRVVIESDGGQGGTAVAGDAAALRAAVAEGLLTAAEPMASYRSGVAFERQVLEALTKGD